MGEGEIITAAAATHSPAHKKKAPKTAKAAAKPQHPTTSVMVSAAIKSLKERGGSSLQAIKKYIAANYKVDAEKLAPFIKKYIKGAVAAGSLVQTKGKGASGSFKIATGEKKPKKTGVAKKPKTKKAATTKKVAGAKKKTSKKAATVSAAPAGEAATVIVVGSAAPATVKTITKKASAAKKAGAKSPKKPKSPKKKAATPKAKKATTTKAKKTKDDHPTKKPKAPKPKSTTKSPKAKKTAVTKKK